MSPSDVGPVCARRLARAFTPPQLTPQSATTPLVPASPTPADPAGMLGGQQTITGNEDPCVDFDGIASAAAYGGADGGAGFAINQGFAAVRQVATLRDAVISFALENPKAGRASTLVEVFRSYLMPGSNVRNHFEYLLRLTGGSLLRADQGLLPDTTLPDSFAAAFWPELPDGAVILANVLQMLRGPHGIPNPNDPRNQPTGSSPPGLSQKDALLARLQEQSIALERAERSQHKLERSDYGMSEAVQVVVAAEGEVSVTSAALARQVEEARSSMSASKAAQATVDNLRQQLQGVAQGGADALNLQQQVEVAAFKLTDRIAQAETTAARHAEAARLHAEALKHVAEARAAHDELEDQHRAELDAAKAAVTALKAQKHDTVACLSDPGLHGQHAGVSYARHAHERMYVTAGNMSMTAAMAYVHFLAALLTVKWGYPTNAQLNSLGVITRGKPMFEGEGPYVPADETYTAFFERVRQYNCLLRLIHRDRDLTSPTLAGIGSNPVDDRVRDMVQYKTYMLPAKDRTPELLERMAMQAFEAASDEAEALRQVQIQQLAEACGLGISSFLGSPDGGDHRQWEACDTGEPERVDELPSQPCPVEYAEEPIAVALATAAMSQIRVSPATLTADVTFEPSTGPQPSHQQWWAPVSHAAMWHSGNLVEGHGRFAARDERMSHTQPTRQHQVDVAVAHMFLAENIHPDSIELQQPLPPGYTVLPQPRASSYASYSQLGGSVQPACALAFTLHCTTSNLTSAEADLDAAVGAIVVPTVVAACQDADEVCSVLSMLSAVSTGDMLAAEQVDSLLGFECVWEPVVESAVSAAGGCCGAALGASAGSLSQLQHLLGGQSLASAASEAGMQGEQASSMSDAPYSGQSPVALMGSMVGVTAGEAEVTQPLGVEGAHTALELMLQAYIGIGSNLGCGVPFGVYVGFFVVVLAASLCWVYMVPSLGIVFACWYTAAAVVAMLLACSGDLKPDPGLRHVKCCSHRQCIAAAVQASWRLVVGAQEPSVHASLLTGLGGYGVPSFAFCHSLSGGVVSKLPSESGHNSCRSFGVFGCQVSLVC